ncbi:LamG-like jellyroll fold domain-containing protein [Candidatus Latescibacterota bacterium]
MSELPRLRLTIGAGTVGSDLANFPLLVRLVAPQEVPKGEGSAPVFLDEEGQPLARVVESWDDVTRTLLAWVRVPRVWARRDTVIHLTWPPEAPSGEAYHDVFDQAHQVVWSPPCPGVGPSVPRTRSVLMEDGSGPEEALTVEAFLHSDSPRSETMQVAVSRWDFAESMTHFATHDAGSTGGMDTTGFFGAICDGRYVYFSPQCNGTGRHGLALRLDTHGELSDPASWISCDAESTDSLDTRGYYGAVYDGRFVYYVPRTDGRTHHSRVLRHDTGHDFDDPRGWAAHDAGVPISYQGAAFDGRYIYFAPGYHQDGGPSGLVLRYDTHAPFDSSASYTLHDAAGTSGLACTCYDGAIFDGRYVYFAPLEEEGAVLRLDTSSDFHSRDSWQAHRVHSVDGLDMGMCVGAAFDGQYVYFSPYAHSVVVRFNTAGDFADPTAWAAHDAGGTAGLKCRGYDGAAFDGRFVYFIPFWEGESPRCGFHARLLRYDTSLSFADPAAWQAADGSAAAPPNPGGFNGGAFDGRYLYMAPWRQDGSSAARLSGDIVSHGQVLRFDTAGEQASFALKLVDCGHNGGLGGAVPGSTFTVNAGAGPVSARANAVPGSGWHHLAGVYDSNQLTLYLDGEMVGRERARGPLTPSQLPVTVGSFPGGTAALVGQITHVRVSVVARSADWIAATSDNLHSPERFATAEVVGDHGS